MSLWEYGDFMTQGGWMGGQPTQPTLGDLDTSVTIAEHHYLTMFICLTVSICLTA